MILEFDVVLLAVEVGRQIRILLELPVAPGDRLIMAIGPLPDAGSESLRRGVERGEIVSRGSAPQTRAARPGRRPGGAPARPQGDLIAAGFS